MKRIFFMAVVALLLPLSARGHAIHMTYATAAITDSNVAIEVSYYDDDLQKAVSSWERRDVATLPEATRNAMIGRYVTSYFRFWNGDKQVAFGIDSMVLDGSSRRIKMHARRDAGLKITLDHRALFQLYSDQLNLITIKQRGSESNHILSPSSPAIYLNS